jgi:plastocyanin
MAILDITKLRPNYKGEWSSSATYVSGDVVSYRKALYSATATTTGFLPQSDTSVTPSGSPWVLMTLDADTAVLVANGALGDTSQGVLYRDADSMKLTSGATNKTLYGSRVAVNYLTTSAQGANKTYTGGTATQSLQTRIASGVTNPNTGYTTGISQSFAVSDEEGVEKNLVTFETSLAREGNTNNSVQVSRFVRNGGTVAYTVANSGTSSYTFTGTDLTGTVSDPALSVRVGDRIVITINAAGHPFYISTIPGATWTLGSHVAPAGVVNNGDDVGTIEFVPQTAGVYHYVCQNHPTAMTGTITVSPRADVRFTPATNSRFQNFGLTKITDFNYPDGTACVKPRWLDQDYA